MKVGFTSMEHHAITRRFITIENGRLSDDLGGVPFVTIEVCKNAAEIGVLGGGTSPRLGAYLDPEEARQLGRILINAADEITVFDA